MTDDEWAEMNKPDSCRACYEGTADFYCMGCCPECGNANLEHINLGKNNYVACHTHKLVVSVGYGISSGGLYQSEEENNRVIDILDDYTEAGAKPHNHDIANIDAAREAIRTITDKLGRGDTAMLFAILVSDLTKECTEISPSWAQNRAKKKLRERRLIEDEFPKLVYEQLDKDDNQTLKDTI